MQPYNAMNLPEGTHIGHINNSLRDKEVQQVIGLVGLIKTTTQQGEGVILIDKGKIIAAFFTSGDTIYYGNEALKVSNATTSEKMEIRSYTADEYQAAVETCRKENLLIRDDIHIPETPNRLDENLLRKLLVQPGVIAVSAFSDGFSVQSFGDADFDQVAAMAEDLLRAGVKIAQDMKIGLIDQIILETVSGKIIIAPYGDLFLCIFTGPDANIGRIRVALKSIQSDAR
ncbi:MAG: roadblock/LC7 domain-containing protein [Methanomicrobiales archaeon]|nr:roadblock/LC7 domain-containing protein [Methanomicrobiales archaeon]